MKTTILGFILLFSFIADRELFGADSLKDTGPEAITAAAQADAKAYFEARAHKGKPITDPMTAFTYAQGKAIEHGLAYGTPDAATYSLAFLAVTEQLVEDSK